MLYLATRHYPLFLRFLTSMEFFTFVTLNKKNSKEKLMYDEFFCFIRKPLAMTQHSLELYFSVTIWSSFRLSSKFFLLFTHSIYCFYSLSLNLLDCDNYKYSNPNGNAKC